MIWWWWFPILLQVRQGPRPWIRPPLLPGQGLRQPGVRSARPRPVRRRRRAPHHGEQNAFRLYISLTGVETPL